MEGKITIKNLYKSSTIYFAGENLPAHTEITPLKGKIPSDSTSFLRVVYHSKIQEVINSEIVIQFRGGKP